MKKSSDDKTQHVMRMAIIRQLGVVRRELFELILQAPCIESARLLSRAKCQIRQAETILEDECDEDVDN